MEDSFMLSLRLGDVTIAAVEEVSGPRLRPDFLLPQSSPNMIARHAHWMAPDLYDPSSGLLAMVRQTNVIRTPHHTILIDTCAGDDKERNTPNFHRLKTPWKNNFKTLGLAFEDVDIVLCTHLHVDHVGWNTRLDNGKWVPTFPNARYLFSRTEYTYWADRVRSGQPDPDGPIFEDSVIPVVEAGQADIVADDHELSNGMWLELSAGHTAGHVCIHLQNEGGHVLFSGDLMHHPIQVREPQLNSRFCLDGAAALAARRRFLDSYADRDVIVVPAHFERGTAGRIVGASDGWHFDFLQGGSTR
jgi:glyoxylase-like metal-dependent hydrolase (beta-lactamase superfamily II)